MTDETQPQAPPRRCPKCQSSKQLPRSVIAHRGVVSVSVRCDDCGEDWQYDREVVDPVLDDESSLPE